MGSMAVNHVVASSILVGHPFGNKMDYKNPVGMLLNEKTKRYHPIVFRPAPMPSQTDKEYGCLRHRSKGHHTDGFDSLEEAMKFISEHSSWMFYDLTWSWDGIEIPAITTWISEKK